MATYRQARNVEASLVDQITTALTGAGWTIRVEKSFSKVYDGELPCICVNIEDNNPKKKEVGSKVNYKVFTIYLRIFAKEDGSRLDLSNFLEDLVENDFNYYRMIVTDGLVAEKILAGKIIVISKISSRKELRNTENLEVKDRFRHLITFDVKIQL